MQKPMVRRSRNFDDIGIDVCCFFVDSGLILVIVCALETALKFDDFSWPPRCAPAIGFLGPTNL